MDSFDYRNVVTFKTSNKDFKKFANFVLFIIEINSTLSF